MRNIIIKARLPQRNMEEEV